MAATYGGGLASRCTGMDSQKTCPPQGLLPGCQAGKSGQWMGHGMKSHRGTRRPHKAGNRGSELQTLSTLSTRLSCARTHG